MEYLIIFIVGILFYYMIPIIDGLSTVLLTWLKTVENRLSEEITLSNIELKQKIDEVEDEGSFEVTGFKSSENR